MFDEFVLSTHHLDVTSVFRRSSFCGLNKPRSGRAVVTVQPGAEKLMKVLKMDGKGSVFGHSLG